MSDARADVFNAIHRERQHQDGKYGSLDRRGLTLEQYLVIALGELGEAAQALARGNERLSRCEAMQAATVLVAMLERHGVVEREAAG